jgi:hypothetical protein
MCWTPSSCHPPPVVEKAEPVGISIALPTVVATPGSIAMLRRVEQGKTARKLFNVVDDRIRPLFETRKHVCVKIRKQWKRENTQT